MPSKTYAADLGCGFGRHTRSLEACGFKVLAIDVLAEALRAVGTARIWPVLANIEAPLPIADEVLGLALAVHCSIHHNLDEIARALAPNGYLVYETFGGHGGNWLDLPRPGELGTKLHPQFEILMLNERRVGPSNSGAMATKLFARKRSHQRTAM